jgi:predicted RNA-binding Zn-ribbon protein involved in translation (DUF1610 family)
MSDNKNQLQSCKACGDMISGTAKICPKCGNARSLAERLTKKQTIAFVISPLALLASAKYGPLLFLIGAVSLIYLLWSMNKK